MFRGNTMKTCDIWIVSSEANASFQVSDVEYATADYFYENVLCKNESVNA